MGFLLGSFRWCAWLAGFLFLLTGPLAAENGNMPAGDSTFVVSDTVVVRSIVIRGNRQTRPQIILRELEFREHDTLPVARVGELLRLSRENVFNTRLFNFVTFDTMQVPGTHAFDLQISVVERWYIWPIPFLEVSDRNFNAWWETRDFSRLTYGVDLTFYNVRGRNETLKIISHFGFNQKYGFTYRIPYLNRDQTIGAGFGADAGFNHEIPVETENNKPVYYKDPSGFPKQVVNAYGEVFYRPSFNALHTFRLGYSSYVFQDTVLRIPGFSVSDANRQAFASIWYQYKNDHRDVHYYPLKGWYLDFELMHCTPAAVARTSYLKLNLRWYHQFSNRWYFATGWTLKAGLYSDQPYYLQRGLGYGREFVRGYEYYVVDGQHFVLWKNNFKFAILPQKVVELGFLNSPKFSMIPLALYLNVFADLGYVFKYYPHSSAGPDNNGNTLQNSLMAGYGLGLDFTTYYDVVVRCDFSMNLFGKPGIYLHFLAPI
jgi:outer membrane protein assembly factor BamA